MIPCDRKLGSLPSRHGCNVRAAIWKADLSWCVIHKRDLDGRCICPDQEGANRQTREDDGTTHKHTNARTPAPSFPSRDHRIPTTASRQFHRLKFAGRDRRPEPQPVTMIAPCRLPDAITHCRWALVTTTSIGHCRRRSIRRFRQPCPAPVAMNAATRAIHKRKTYEHADARTDAVAEPAPVVDRVADEHGGRPQTTTRLMIEGKKYSSPWAMKSSIPILMRLRRVRCTAPGCPTQLVGAP